MARINTNVASMVAQHNLQKSNNSLKTSLERLSTGLRINRGADDPAGLIISERLRSEIAGIDSAIGNAERGTNVISTAEAALAEVANLLTSIKSLVVQSANTGALSQEEIEANQLQVDDAISSITRIANTTSFAGLKLLNGALDYTTSGLATSAISDVSIRQANFGTNASVPVTVQVISSAQKANLFLSTGTTSMTSAVTVEIKGTKGVEVLNFAATTALSAVAFAINGVSDSTGVVASIVSGAAAGLSAIAFTSSDYGTDSFVSVSQLGTTADFFHTYDAVGGNETNRDEGDDVLALINGTLALGRGTEVKLNTNSLNLVMNLTEDMATQTTTTSSFDITGGGAIFQIGREVESSQQVSFGIGSIASSRLGNSIVGYLSSIVSGGDNSLVGGNMLEASDIIDAAITQVSTIRGRLGAFEKNTLQTNIRSLQIALENITSSESQIRDADFAAETSSLTRAQLLVNVGTTVLATANAQTSSVLQLLQ